MYGLSPLVLDVNVSVLRNKIINKLQIPTCIYKEHQIPVKLNFIELYNFYFALYISNHILYCVLKNIHRIRNKLVYCFTKNFQNSMP